MNVSHPLAQNPLVDFSAISPAFIQLTHDTPRTLSYLLIPTELLYFAIYFLNQGYFSLHRNFTILSIATFWLSLVLAPIQCGPVSCLQNFAIAIGTMKALDLYAQRNSLPQYKATSRRPADWLLPILLITELRYESFTPNQIRQERREESFSEPMQFGLHLLAFMVLQSFPQTWSPILAYEVLLAIYILWTAMQLCLRYKSSSALFGPLYRTGSLNGFWSVIWHNAFASPCSTLCYRPLRNLLPRLYVPVPVAKAIGILAAFGLMAVFHMFALAPLLQWEGLSRIGHFFIINGAGIIAEKALWGERRHWLKCVLAWGFETAVASWVVEGLEIPMGVHKIPWKDMCAAMV